MSRRPFTLKQVYYPTHIQTWYRLQLQQLARRMGVEALEVLQQHAAPTAARANTTGPLGHPPAPFPRGAQDGVRTDGDGPEDPGRATVGAAALDDVFDMALRRALVDWGVRWEQRFDRMAHDLAKLFAKRSLRYLDQAFKKRLQDAGYTVRFQPTARMVTAHQAVVDRNVALIRSIPRKFHCSVELAVTRAVRKGGDRQQLSKVVKRRYGVTYRRAALIARDQVAKSHAAFESARRAELGITTAEWLHSHAGRVPRPEHVAWGRERRQFDVTKGLWSDVDHEWQLPGTAINCRCGSRAVIPDSFVRAYDRRATRLGTKPRAQPTV